MPRRQKPEQTPNFWDSVAQDRLILFKVPPRLDLTPASKLTEQETAADKEVTDVPTTTIRGNYPRRRTANITALPPEIILEIASYLHPVDRICLGLTCKSLLSSTLPTLRFTPLDWVRFNDRQYSYILPQMPTLYVRLAHGWVPKDRFRYCCRCYKILPRSPEYFRQRLCRKKNPRFHSAVGLTEKEWRSMSKKQKYAHLIEDWCHSPEDDSSGIFCGYCYQRERDNMRCPVHCPLCLETDLTWSPPRKPWVRKALCRCLRNLWTPFELLAYWALFCCMWAVKFVYDQGRLCWRLCIGLCCSG